MKRWILGIPFITSAVTGVRADFDAGTAAFEIGDYTSALREWRPLAEAGHADAQYWVGYIHIQGVGVQQDYRMAGHWLSRAAQQNHVEAQYTLGYMLLEGLGFQQDHEAGFAWCLSASQQGHAGAMYSVGQSYRQGIGVERSDKEALRWYRKAAACGQTEAQFLLGLMTFKGMGTRQDYVRSHMWFNLAASQGHADALKALASLAQGMTAEDVSEAQGLARHWKPKECPADYLQLREDSGR